MVSVEQKCPRQYSHLGTITTKIAQDGRLLCSSVLQGRNIVCYNKPKLEFIKIVKLRQGSGKGRQGMALKAKGLKA